MTNRIYEEDNLEVDSILENIDNNEKTFTFLVDAENAAKRADVFLASILEKNGEDISRSLIKKVADSGFLVINDKKAKANSKLKVGDTITISFPEEDKEIRPENIELDIVYEDEYLLVINKARGMVVHPAAGHYSGTVVNALLYRDGDNLADINGKDRPGIVHRIDRDTSGLLVCAKNNEVASHLSDQLKTHSMTRRYQALVHNPFEESGGKIDKALVRGTNDRKKIFIAENGQIGRMAITHYKVIENFNSYAFVECKLETGRTHQIRVHMKSIGHAVIGDPLYSKMNFALKTKGQMLHAKTLGFIHPVTNEYMEWDSSLPEDMTNVINWLRSSKK